MSNMNLWDQYRKTHDKKIKDQLIVKYIDLVKIIAGRLYANYRNNAEFEDLVSYGIFGLLDAIDKFDLSKNVKFETYAYIRIRGAIIDQLRTLDWIPRSVRQKYKKIEDAYKAIENKLGRSARDQEVATELNVSVAELNSMLGEVHSFSVISLEEKISNNANFTIMDEDISSEPQQSLEQEEVKKILLESLNELAEREKKIIELYYYSELTYKEISAILGVSESRISQLHTKAIMKLRGKLAKIL
ncbi:FliA/WhiG family RNA polymerase sigma factor [Crassaminicella profunda]|uniref:FliA/WhiG family RNA polymerase sigma factor n=1 Tax=Crassaminicella profunda TaxID=1286698 RepID=UPI001CA75287|nr:FliA/WhiG family RNA polymerase sigma factor [Crassaminicella profunda]QZY56776.1 FliA/WhiG family RNA polymerase sigma factor [Crassaminicella profunda]